jgi:hypothetical protein
MGDGTVDGNIFWPFTPVIGQAGRRTKQNMLDEFCANTGCHRRHAMRLLNGLRHPRTRPHPVHRSTYGTKLVSVPKGIL